MITKEDVQDLVVKNARSLPDLVASAKISSPELYDQLSGKPIAQSKTIWGMVVTLGLVYVLRQWGLQYDQATLDIASGCIIMAVTAVCRFVTASPITSWLRHRVG